MVSSNGLPVGWVRSTNDSSSGPNIRALGTDKDLPVFLLKTDDMVDFPDVKSGQAAIPAVGVDRREPENELILEGTSRRYRFLALDHPSPR